jgi:hypothetical protein
MIRLPVSGQQARWRPATGHQDVALAESRPGLEACARYAEQIAGRADGTPLDAGELPVGDLDVLLVAWRRELLGDAMTAEGDCLACGAAVDVRFSLAAYAEHHRPRAARGACPGEDGWWQLGDTWFRLPTVRDVLAAAAAPAAATVLLRACLRDAGPPAGTGAALAVPAARPAAPRGGRKAGQAVERAMSALAPTLRADVTGTCPDCGAAVRFDVDARELCMSELRYHAASVFTDVHLIASCYGWPQQAILDLPPARRRVYADLVAGERARLAGAVP